MDYSQDDIKSIVSNVAEDEYGFKFIEILLDKLGAFERGCNFQNQQADIYNRGKREQGLWLLDLLKESNFNKFVEIEKERMKLCQKTLKINKD